MSGGGDFVGMHCAGNSNTPIAWVDIGGKWADVLMNISPYFYAYTGTALALGLSVIGAAWGMWLTGASILGGAVKAPKIRSKNLISVIFCEATAIFGLIIAIIAQGSIKYPSSGTIPSEACAKSYYVSYAIFWAGLSVGITNFISGIAVGVSGSNCAIADAGHSSLFVKMLVVEIFASALSIFGLIIGVILLTKDQFPTM